MAGRICGGVGVPYSSNHSQKAMLSVLLVPSPCTKETVLSWASLDIIVLNLPFGEGGLTDSSTVSMQGRGKMVAKWCSSEAQSLVEARHARS